MMIDISLKKMNVLRINITAVIVLFKHQHYMCFLYYNTVILLHSLVTCYNADITAAMQTFIETEQKKKQISEITLKINLLQIFKLMKLLSSF